MVQVRMKATNPNYFAGQIGELGQRSAPGATLRWVEFGVERHGSTGCWCAPAEYELISPFMPDLVCRGCRRTLTAKDALDNDPHPGALTICTRCGEMGYWVNTTIGLTIRALTDAERDTVLRDPNVIRVRLAVINLNMRLPNQNG